MNHAESPSSSPPQTGLSSATRRSIVEWATVAFVFTLTFAIRWPFLAESFWVDELHTAWCIADSFGDVAPRAKMGNQQPLYFQILWFWQHFPWPEPFASYPVEVLLRSTSLWCVSLSAALLTWGSLRWHGSVLAALATGSVMAIDRNAAFFGTELRPYAVAILFGTLAIFFVANLCRDRGHTRRRDWVGLHACVLAAAFMHVTTLLTLAPLVFAITVLDLWAENREGMRRIFVRHHVGWFAAWCLAAIVLVTSQQDVWDRRDAWAAFGQPRTPLALWKLWPWTGWAIVPLGALVAALMTKRWASTKTAEKGRLPEKQPTWRTRFASLSFGVLLGSAVLGYVLSEFGGVPLWHRRYLIAGLPLGCILLGHCIALMQQLPHSKFWMTATITASLLAIAWTQGSLIQWNTTGWARPHENWRGALQQIASESHSKQLEDGQPFESHVWIDADLIEQPAISGSVTDEPLATYLTMVARGPYSIGEHATLHAMGSVEPLDGWGKCIAAIDNIASGTSDPPNGSKTEFWLVVRNPFKKERLKIAAFSDEARPSPKIALTERFGSVWVLKRVAD